MSLKLNFDNTAIAFRDKTNLELKKAYLLFSFFAYPWLLKTGTTLANLTVRYNLPFQFLIRWTVFSQFCGGENIQDCQKSISRLASNGISSILDYSLEGKETEDFFDQATEEIFNTILAAQAQPENISFSVFKLTGICQFSLLERKSAGAMAAEDQAAWERVKQRVDRLCKAAFERGVRLLIDAEESWIQDAIDELAHEMMRKYNREQAIIYNTIQLYRHDRLAFLQRAVAQANQEGFHYAAKLVRGAYMEKERLRAEQMGYLSPIQLTKADTDRDYDAALDFCVQHDIAICAGSHNESSNLLLAELLNKYQKSPNDSRFYFAQLLGMSDHISYNLAAAGFRVAKYVPYGPIREVIPYLIRRAQENSSVEGQTGRELRLIIQELDRRKKQ